MTWGKILNIKPIGDEYSVDVSFSSTAIEQSVKLNIVVNCKSIPEIPEAVRKALHNFGKEIVNKFEDDNTVN